MLFSDTYKVPATIGEGLFKDKGSKFMAFVYPIKNEEEVKMYLQQLKKEHFSAAHHCYGYVLGFDKQIQKSNDDREPSNTAGKPILRSILAKDLTNTLVVVVRYFGGKLLGVPGLIQAYGEAAADALNSIPIVEKIITEKHELRFDYSHENEAFKIIKQFSLKILQHHHAEEITIIFEVRKSQAEAVLHAIKEKRIFETTFLGEQ
ncbi:MAG: YigZ family protein [Bacteroidota bacterium]